MLIIANFKQNLTKQDYQAYIKYMSESANYKVLNSGRTQNVFCPPFPYLNIFSKLAEAKNISLGSQDASSFVCGSNTGEVGAFQLKDFCNYVILGHSERRIQLGETAEVINKKIQNVLSVNITPIVCVRNLEDLTCIYSLEGVLIAYEPVENIGGKEAAGLGEIEAFYNSTGLSSGIIYGGSVNSTNVMGIASLGFINGLLIGGASLDPKLFLEILKSLNPR